MFDLWPARGRDALDALKGDFAFALWDGLRCQLVLARGPLSEIPLAYSNSSDATHFSSLAVLLGAGSAPDIDWLARQQSGAPVFGSRSTIFTGVAQVEPGTMVTCSAVGVRVERFWFASSRHRLSDDQAADGLRLALDEAVADAIADVDADAIIATQLSAGRDSGAVTATAANTLRVQARKLLAFTSVPDAGLETQAHAALGDEGPGASAVAGLHGDVVDHRLVKVRRADLGLLLDQRNCFLPGPHGTPVNLPWYDRIQALASTEGASLLLSGACGNLTISSGGPWPIGELLATGDLTGWIRAMRQARRFPGSSLINLLNLSFGPWLPPALHASLLSMHRADSEEIARGTFLRGQLAERTRSLARERHQPPRRWSAARASALEASDCADAAGEILHGVTMRDPTADRRVVEACLTLSPRQLASPYDERPIFARAFADRLPPTTVKSAIRHYQGTDWFKAIDPVALSLSLEHYRKSAAVAEYLDVNAMQTAIACWPRDGLVDTRTTELYTDQLLPAVSIASFLSLHWPG